MGKQSKKKVPAGKSRYTIRVPESAYSILRARANENGSSLSALIAAIIEDRFGKPSRSVLPFPPAECEERLVMASVFLHADLYKAAVHESERQHGAVSGDVKRGRGRETSVFSRVVRGLIDAEVGR